MAEQTAAKWFGERVTRWAAEMFSAGTGGLSLWAGVVGAPAVWATQLQVGYMLVPWACRAGQTWVLHLVTLLFVLLSAAGVFLCWVDWKAVGRGWPGGGEEGAGGRVRFLSVLGMMIGGLFTLLILAQGIASFIISPCWK